MQLFHGHAVITIFQSYDHRNCYIFIFIHDTPAGKKKKKTKYHRLN